MLLWGIGNGNGAAGRMCDYDHLKSSLSAIVTVPTYEATLSRVV
jgi:hypothetical protein